MTYSPRLRMSRVLGTSLAVVALATSIVAPASAATPAAAATAADVVATIKLPHGSYQLSPGRHAMWAMSGDETLYSTLYRIDPATNQATMVAHLGFPAAGLTVGYGSVWVTDYYASTLVRLSPTGRVQATIRVGLQPQVVHIAFGSVWTSNHHSHSITRIDPLTNGVAATINVGANQFRDGPQDFTNDGRYLYAESSNLPHLQRIDPATNTRVNLVNTGLGYGGDLIWTSGPHGGTLWNAPVDLNTNQILVDGYRVDGSVRVTEALPSTVFTSGIAHLGHTVYLGEDINGVTGHARIQSVDQVTGAVVRTQSVPGQIDSLRTGFGDLWSTDGNTIRRIHLEDPT